MTARDGRGPQTRISAGELAECHRREAGRLLARLAKPGLHAERRDDRLVLVRRATGVSMAIATPVAALAGLLHSGAVACLTKNGRARFEITEEGRARLRRQQADENGFGDQHREIERREIRLPEGAADIRVNLREDPLEMLRRTRHLAKLIGEAEIEAGMRLRRDMHLAGTAPRVTANWSRLVVDGAGYQPGLSESEVISEARRRVNAALKAVGPDFANVLVDICAFSKGLEAVEREKALPARSGKVVLGLGLRALARHYGMANAAIGASLQPIRQWGAEDFRPAIKVG